MNHNVSQLDFGYEKELKKKKEEEDKSLIKVICSQRSKKKEKIGAKLHFLITRTFIWPERYFWTN